MQQVGATKKDSFEFGYKRLLSWQEAYKLAHMVYDMTLAFPKDELYSLTSQIRRAALSVPANIAEGHARNNRKEFRHFLAIALGSLTEVEYYIGFAQKRSFITPVQFDSLMQHQTTCGKLLWNLHKSQR